MSMQPMKAYAALFPIILLGHTPLFAQNFNQPLLSTAVNEHALAKDAVKSIGEKASELVVLMVDKTALKANLVTWPDHMKDSLLLKNFTIAIGKERGDKFKQGDNKTPEGIYLTESILDGKGLPAKYGPFAIPLNYPNPFDKYEGKTGYGIWLHGVISDDRVEEANVTEGCVAFYNADIKQLISWLRPSQGVVVIAESLQDVNRAEDVNAVRAATDAWYKAWASRNVDDYIGAYAPNFENAGMNRDQYKTYKSNVFRSYKVMDVAIDKVRVLTHPKYAITLMDQDFSGDKRFTSSGRKVLYWRKQENGTWAIMREIHENKRFEYVKFTRDGKTASVVTETAGVESKL